MRVVIDHVKPRAFALCFLYLPPPVILDTAVQLRSPGLPFSGSSESARELVTPFYVVQGEN
jgi:hypothetical protein